MNDQPQKLPIGYWLKKADEALTRAINRALEARGLTRFHWQLLNRVAEAGVIMRGNLLEPLLVFVDESQADALIAEYIQKGWLAQRKDGSGEVLLSLTEAGQTAHAELLQVLTGVRRRAMEGIPAAEYETVIRVLETMIRNLE